MQMRGAGASCIAYRRYHLAAPDSCAFAHQIAPVVGVHRREVVGMFHDQDVAIAAQAIGEDHGSVACRMHGRPVARDDVEALDWFRKSAGRGYASAMHSIGKMYVEGRAVDADLVEALAWYRVADSRYPPEDAAEAKSNQKDIEELSARLDEDQLARVKERVAAIDVLTTPAKPEPRKPLQPGEKST